MQTYLRVPERCQSSARALPARLALCASLSLALLFCACSLITRGLGAAECDNSFTARCDGAVLLLCEQGFINRQTCAQSCIASADGAVCSVCGNGEIEPGEQCDGGANCRADCTIPFCGDGIVDPGELCDGQPGCNPSCQSLCGNNTLEVGELCDDGNTADGDGCRADCTGFEVCGDGLLDVGESCDDGNNVSNDGCSAGCVLEFCGDGVLNFDPTFGLEECDDGNTQNDAACDSNCTLPACNNGIVDAGEVCFLTPSTALGVGGFPSAIAAGDMDGDGDNDLVVTQSGVSKVTILFNNGAGLFDPSSADPTVKTEFATSDVIAVNDPQDVALGDVDGDQDLDIVVANQGTDEVAILSLSNAGQAAAITRLAAGDGTLRVLLRDLNNDQKLDIVALNRNVHTVSIFLQGAAGFSKVDQVVGNFPLGIDAGDIDGDADLDLVTADKNDQQLTFLLNNAGDFSSQVQLPLFAENRSPDAVLLVDFDGDGKVDVFDTSATASVVFRKNIHPGGAFTAASLAAPVNTPMSSVLTPTLISCDPDNNQTPNVALADLTSGGSTLLLSLSSIDVAISGTSFVRDIVAVDLNGDGAQDLATAESDAISGDSVVNVILANP